MYCAYRVFCYAYIYKQIFQTTQYFFLMNIEKTILNNLEVFLLLTKLVNNSHGYN